MARTRLWLVGLMGSGKTSAGRMAADRLGLLFWDSDALVEERAGCTIPELWDQVGEGGFRAIEKEVTASLASRDGVVATGGGVVLDPANRAVLTRTGKVVWLRGAPETLASRIINHLDRPLLRSSKSVATTLGKLARQRRPLYEEVATHVVDTDDKDLDQVARAIEEIWNA